MPKLKFALNIQMFAEAEVVAMTTGKLKEVFNEKKIDAYNSTGEAALLGFVRANKKARVKSLGTAVAGAELYLQVLKRIKGKDTPTTGATASARALASIDAYTTQQWGTAKITKSVLKQFGIQMDIADGTVASNICDNENAFMEKFNEAWSDAVIVQEAEELIGKMVAASGTKKVVWNGTDSLWSLFTKLSNQVKYQSDEFRHFGSRQAFFVTQPIADKVSVEKGTKWETNPNFIAEGVGNAFRMGQRDFVVCDSLHTFADTDGKVLCGICLDQEAMYSEATLIGELKTTDLGPITFHGGYYYNVCDVVFPSFIGLVFADKTNLDDIDVMAKSTD